MPLVQAFEHTPEFVLGVRQHGVLDRFQARLDVLWVSKTLVCVCDAAIRADSLIGPRRMFHARPGRVGYDKIPDHAAKQEVAWMGLFIRGETVNAARGCLG